MSPNLGASSGIEKERTDVDARDGIGKYQQDSAKMWQKGEEPQGCRLGDTGGTWTCDFHISGCFKSHL